MSKPGYILIATCCLLAFGCDSDESDIQAAFESADYGIDLDSPEYGQGFAAGEEIEFKAHAVLFDSRGAHLNSSFLNHLDIKLYSDVDGLLDGDLANETETSPFALLICRRMNTRLQLKLLTPLTGKEVSVYSFPEMKKLEEIETRGYPSFVFFKGTRLVVVSAVSDFDRHVGPYEVGFEIFDLLNWSLPCHIWRYDKSCRYS